MFAVFLATPGNSSISSIVFGTLPLCLSEIILQAALMFFALLRKKPVERANDSSSAMSASAKLRAVLKRANNAGVTLFTLSSVHCADKMVEMRSSRGEEWSSEQLASGQDLFSEERIFSALSFLFALDSAMALFLRHVL